MKRFLVYTLSFVFFVACSDREVYSDREAYLIDNVVSSKEEFERLDASEIFSINKLDPNNEISCFPDGEHRVPVVVVTTKKTEEERQRQRHALLNLILDSAPNREDILVIKNGFIYPTSAIDSLRNLSSDQLSNTSLMAEQDARVLYGSRAKPITLFISTYQKPELQYKRDQ